MHKDNKAFQAYLPAFSHFSKYETTQQTGKLTNKKIQISYLYNMILVTGGTGFLGGHLLLELLRSNVPIRALINENSDSRKVLSVWKHYVKDTDSLHDKVEWYAADISNKASVEPAFESIDLVYHCAAIVSFNPGMKEKMHEVNVTGTKNIVNLCIEKKIKKLVHVSSIAAIRSSLNGDPVTETGGWPLKARSWYSKTKTLAEMEVWRGIEEGLNSVLVNPSIILGPGKWNTGSPRFFGVCYKGLRHFTRGTTGYVDVRDVVKIMILLMQSNISGERFILNATNLSYEEVFRKIASALHVKAPHVYAPPYLTGFAWRAEFIKHMLTGIPPVITKQSARSAHLKHIYSAKKIEETLNFTFRPVDETIRDVAAMFLTEIS